MGDSGITPKAASESCFVAAEGTGVVVSHVASSGDIVALSLQTTRVVGTVDAEGFLAGNGLLHDGATTTQVAFAPDGPAGALAAADGRYSGSFTATTQAGLYAVVVSAERADPSDTDFQRPPLLLTGDTSDHGTHKAHMERPPYEELVVEIEVDAAVAADVEATVNLHAEDGAFVAPGRAFSSLAPGPGMVAFRFRASQVFGAGKPDPYVLQLLSLWGTAADGTPVQLQATGVVAVTQPYQLEEFAPTPGFTVGGTVTGLLGTGLELELSAEGPPGTPATTTLRRSFNGPFTFLVFPKLVSGNPYQVRVKTHPTNPVQACTVTNASGTIEDANVTNIEVRCVWPRQWGSVPDCKVRPSPPHTGGRMSAGDSTTQGNPDPAIRREPANSPADEPALSIEEQRWLLHTPDSLLRAIIADLFQGQPDDNWSAVGFDPVALWVVRQADGSLRITLRPGEGGEGFFDYRLTMKLSRLIEAGPAARR